MPGLSGEGLPVETLAACEEIEYYSRCFVTGDPRGLRVAVVLSVDDTPGNELPVSIDTGDPLPLTIFMRRRRDVLGAVTTKAKRKNKLSKVNQIRVFNVLREGNPTGNGKAGESSVIDLTSEACQGEVNDQAARVHLTTEPYLVKKLTSPRSHLMSQVRIPILHNLPIESWLKLMSTSKLFLRGGSAKKYAIRRSDVLASGVYLDLGRGATKRSVVSVGVVQRFIMHAR
ncbi:hypothetical protein GN958_ATG03320 [Phytophthora infestans]|uniref:Uncharacterized protein n=1 Tax=Phytophthora infestans TaxID=4787 RepID=A0A8S9VA83_PHYIN|nr:hypothetical protein GN958_ATG13495 [Phytophthora infestans]KAF4147448.1 hypothetical protein GN958_ATG03320 [Phytophthora infestans]